MTANFTTVQPFNSPSIASSSPVNYGINLLIGVLGGIFIGFIIGILTPYHVSFYKITKYDSNPKQKCSISYSSISQSVSIHFKKPEFYCHPCKKAFHTANDQDMHTFQMHRNLIKQNENDETVNALFSHHTD